MLAHPMKEAMKSGNKFDSKILDITGVDVSFENPQKSRLMAPLSRLSFNPHTTSSRTLKIKLVVFLKPPTFNNSATFY